MKKNLNLDPNSVIEEASTSLEMHSNGSVVFVKMSLLKFEILSRDRFLKGSWAATFLTSLGNEVNLRILLWIGKILSCPWGEKVFVKDSMSFKRTREKDRGPEANRKTRVTSFSKT